MSSYGAMGDFLQQHAYRNVWCAPDQDKQAILQPRTRLTRPGGDWKSTKVGWRKVSLPDQKSRFHVYHIGQIHPMLLGLTAMQDQWLSVPDVCNQQNLIVDIYNVQGVQIHRSQVWYRVTQDKSLIMAVRIPEYSRIPIKLDEDNLYIHLYTNAYYQSSRASGVNDVIHVQGIQAATNADVMAIQTAYNSWKAKPQGYTYCFVNGRVVEKIDLINAKPGDYIEFVYDGSVKRVVEFNVRDLLSFESDLDNIYKYLLHYPGVTDQIDYLDDVELFLVKPNAQGTRFKGIYFHKNNENALRQLTHKDYAIPVDYIPSYVQARPELGGVPEDLKLIMLVRHSGFLRPLVHEHSRVKDLYRMADADIVKAMIGVDATVSVWTAEALENSGYVKIMGRPSGQISLDDVEQGYGYNAISKILGDTPFRTTLFSGQHLVRVPEGLRAGCTAYEYDANGLMLEYHHHFGNDIYAAINPNTRMVELIQGLASEDLESFWGVQSHPINPDLNYRFYKCGKAGNVVDNNWVDVTGSSQYAVINNQVTWVTNPATTFTMVRSNKKHLVYELAYLAVDGLITFSLQEFRSSLGAYRVMNVPLGEFDVFLNGKSLINGVDYIVDFPRVTIINKEYLINPDSQAQRIVVRHTGFCTQDLKMQPRGEVGFVQYGTLSFNNRYDIRDDHVNRIVVDGALYRYDELTFGEEDFSIGVTDARNGSPYCIRDIVVPMNGFINPLTGNADPTYTLRARSQLVDKEISDYLTLKIPQKDPTPPSAIPTMYQVVSPFFCKIIYDLLSGALWDDKFLDHYSDDFVRQTCDFYEYLLEWDPINPDNQLDPLFVTVHPHNLNHYVQMGIYQHKFLTRVQSIYGRDKIDLSAMVSIAPF